MPQVLIHNLLSFTWASFFSGYSKTLDHFRQQTPQAPIRNKKSKESAADYSKVPIISVVYVNVRQYIFGMYGRYIYLIRLFEKKNKQQALQALENYLLLKIQYKVLKGRRIFLDRIGLIIGT